MRIIKNILLLLFFFILLACLGGYFWLQTQKPRYNGDVKYYGLNEDVEVKFDEFGVPHIYASSRTDAFKALGYVHAQERLFQMEMLRRVGAGRLSEILGSDFIEIDKFFRTLGIEEHAKASVEELYKTKGEHLQLAEAYLDGINTYIENGPTPLEFYIIGIPKAAFTLTDVHNSIGYMAFSFAQAFKTEPLVEKISKKYGKDYVKDLVIQWDKNAATIPVYFKDNGEKIDSIHAIEFTDSVDVMESVTETITTILDGVPVPPFLGSNSWVVAPQKTENGKVILANDTHIAFSQPSVWYEAHIETPDFKYYGNFLAGFPYALVGHSDHHAIGLTMFENDDIDLFYEQINSDNENQYLADSNWLDFKVRQEEINVKDAGAVAFEVKETRHGPIVNEVLPELGKDKAVSAWWVYTKVNAIILEAAYNLMFADDISIARKGASQIHGPGLNVMYGDVDGNIAWWASAKLPIRPEHVNPKFILDGASGKDDPLGFYDFDMNPQSENPPSGYVYSANNQPDSVKGVYHYGYYIPEDRAVRIMEMLDKEDSWNVEKMKTMILDDISPVYPKIAKEIASVVESTANNLNTTERACIDLLDKWDGNHAQADIAPTVFHHVFYKVLAFAMKDELGEKDFDTYLKTFISRRTNALLIANDSSIWWDDVATEKMKESRNYILIHAYKEAIAELETRLGSDMNEWQWNKVHSIEHAHALGKVEALRGIFNVGPYPIAGGTEVINNQGFIWNESGKYEVTWGPAMRRIIDYSDYENSISVLPTGQSGNVLSPHYGDQAEMYVNGEFRKQKMNREEISQTSTGTLHLRKD
ncbi:MAG: penicillin acylase family protein [Thalassobius sp.]|nr:penicillin acylase family protein [Thalassovita sp.]